MAAASRIEGSADLASMFPAAAASMREGSKRGCSFGMGLEEERARFVVAQSLIKVRRAAASAREWTIPTAIAMPPSLKGVIWTFMHGRPWYSFESWRAKFVCMSRNSP